MDTSLPDRHVTRDARPLTRGGREIVHVDDAEDLPPASEAADGTVSNTTVMGWYQRQGDWWVPIFEPHEPGVIDAVADAAAGNVACAAAPYGGCSGPSLEVKDFVDDLVESGWRLVRTKP